MSHPDVAPSPKAVRAQLDLWAMPQARAVRVSGALGVFDVVCVVGFAWGLSHMVSALWGHEHSLDLILVPMLAVIGSLGLRAALGVINQKLNLDLSRRIIAAIRLDVMDKALGGRIDAAAGQGRLNALFEDTEALEGYYARFRQASVQAVAIPLIVVALIALKSPVSAGLLGLTLLPFVALMALLGMSSAAESKRQLDALSRLSNLFIDRIKALPLIMSFDAGARQVKAVGRAAENVAERTLRVLKVAFLTSAVLEFFSALSVALIAVYCGFYLLGQIPFKVPEHLDLATAFFVLALSPEVYAPMRRLSAAYHDRQSAMAAAERLMGLEVTPPMPVSAATTTAPGIVFDGVVCGFRDDADFRIGPVSFTAAPATITALTGPTGSGKTTLLRLLLGQGQIMAGKINIDNKALDEIGDLTANIAWVSQHPPILAGTIHDNLVLAKASASDAEIERAIDEAGLRALVDSREGGLQHVLSERGSGLSGGELRRIGLARALLKSAPILLLDEPTADLDAESEAELIATFATVFKGRTVLFSSHSPRLCALSNHQVTLA